MINKIKNILEQNDVVCFTNFPSNDDLMEFSVVKYKGISNEIKNVNTYSFVIELYAKEEICELLDKIVKSLAKDVITIPYCGNPIIKVIDNKELEDDEKYNRLNISFSLDSIKY